MNQFVKPAVVLGLAGAMALGTMTTSDARGRGWVAGAAGFAVGAAIGAAASNAAYGGYGYYGDGYAYAPAPGYGYYNAPPAVTYSYGAGPGDPAYAYTGDPAYANSYAYSPYGPRGNTNWTGPMRERQLDGHDY